MTKKVALIVAGIVFGIAAIVHLIRLFTHFPIVLGGHEIPISTSGWGLLAALILASWMLFSASRGK